MIVFLAAMATVLVLLPVIVLGAVIYGSVLSLLWDWFVVPLFGLPALSLPQAMGLALLARYVTTDTVAAQPHTTLQALATALLVQPGLVLVCAWMITLFL